MISDDLWRRLMPYVKINVKRSNLDVLQLPDDLRREAAAVMAPCAACGAPVRVFRARMRSQRSRVSRGAEERRLFYAATCPENVNPGCARSRAAKHAKAALLAKLGTARSARPVFRLELRDAAGQVLYYLEADGTEAVRFDVSPNAREISICPVKR